MLIRIAAFSFVMCVATGCTQAPITPSASNSTQTAKPQSSRLNAVSSPKSQRYSSDRQNQLDDQGYRNGYEDGFGGFPASPNIGITNLNLTAPTEIQIYTDAYNRGFTQGKGEQTSPSPSPLPTSNVSPGRRAELQRQGNQNGRDDAQSNFAANPASGIAALGLTIPAEIQIYTTAYNAGYRTKPLPPLITRKRLAELRQQGYNDGDADAQSNLPQDPNRSTTLSSLVNATEQQAYTDGYNAGYQASVPTVNPTPGVVLW